MNNKEIQQLKRDLEQTRWVLKRLIGTLGSLVDRHADIRIMILNDIVIKEFLYSTEFPEYAQEGE